MANKPKKPGYPKRYTGPQPSKECTMCLGAGLIITGPKWLPKPKIIECNWCKGMGRRPK